MGNVWEYWTDCDEVARLVYGARPPTDDYARAVARLLFMTGSHESLWRWRRQRCFEGLGADHPNRWRGGFGLYQLEWGSIRDSLCLLARRSALRHHTLEVLRDHDVPVGILDVDRREKILGLLETASGDFLGCVLARLHYLRVPAPIPEGVTEQAWYAKKYYNTYAGKATPKKYEAAFRANWDRLRPSD